MPRNGNLLAVVTALPEEMDGVLHAGRFRKVRPEVWRGKLSGVPCVAAVLGIGKVRAAARTQLVLDLYNPGIVLHMGTAGATNPELSFGDLIAGRRLAQHDFAISEASRSRLKYPVWQETPEYLLDLAFASARRVSLTGLRAGRIVTGDRPIIDSLDRNALRDDFGADCVDMESAAVTQVCWLQGIPCLTVRAISDGCNANSRRDFRANIEAISRSLGAFAAAMAGELALDFNPFQRFPQR